MNPTLERLRDDVRLAVGQYYAIQQLADQTIDAALRAGLHILQSAAEPAIAIVTVQQAGYTQDLSLLVRDLSTPLSVTYPWNDDRPTMYGRNYEQLSRSLVVFAPGVVPQVGDKIRIVYRRRLMIAELDGASATNLPDVYEAALIKATCAQVLRSASMQIAAAIDGKADYQRSRQLAEYAIELESEATAEIYSLYTPVQNPSWSRIGL